MRLAGWARCGLALLLLCVAAVSRAQISFGEDGAAAAAKKQRVEMLSEAADLRAGAPQVVELRFKVEPGFHINSHHPKDELLIATGISWGPAEGVHVLGMEYPAGHAFRLPGANEALDVYEDEFRVRLRVQADHAGTAQLAGALRYQACDNAACFPPRSLPIRMLLTVR